MEPGCSNLTSIPNVSDEFRPTANSSSQKKLGKVEEKYNNANKGEEINEIIDLSIFSSILSEHVLCKQCRNSWHCSRAEIDL